MYVCTGFTSVLCAYVGVFMCVCVSVVSIHAEQLFLFKANVRKFCICLFSFVTHTDSQ